MTDQNLFCCSGVHMMTVVMPLSGHWQAQVYFTLFFSFALAALQNVTIDDAAVTGSVVPTYLPAASDWNQGNNCLQCLAKPDPSMAYDGTWHDTTYYPNSLIFQAFEFTFVGSGLYIFFILANSVTFAVTFTNVDFILDGVQVSSFTHTPSTSTDYEYNQVVYANDSIPYGQHTMMVAPVNDTVNEVLMLFDYLIYTTDSGSDTSSNTGSSSSAEAGTVVSVATYLAPTGTASGSVVYLTTMLSLPSSGASATSPGSTTPESATPEPASLGTSATSSGVNTSAILGAVVGALCAAALVATAILCYRRHKRRTGNPSPPVEGAIEAPFVQTAPTSSFEDIQRCKGNVSATPATVMSSNPLLTAQSESEPEPEYSRS